MDDQEIIERNSALLAEFNKDSKIVGEQTEKYLRLVYPSYLVDKDNIEPLMDSESAGRLESMSFFRICSCTADNVEKVFENVNEHFEKLFTALYSINIPIAYGVVSDKGVTNLVIGVYQSNQVSSLKSIMQGMLSGIELKEVKPKFKCETNQTVSNGILAGVPSLFVNGEKQRFSLSSIMRSLNGQNYALLFVAKPVEQNIIAQNISDLISVRDKAFAVSKRNVSRANSYTQTATHTGNVSDGQNSMAGQVGSGTGAGIGAAAGAIAGSFLFPGLGTMAGTTIGGIIGGGLGNVIGNIVGKGKTHSEGYSDSISKAIAEGDTVSGDIQNGFALELMNYADNAIERLKGGQNNGIWQTAIAYAGENDTARDIIRACLSGELSKLDSEKLPLISFEPKRDRDTFLRIPDFLDGSNQNGLCSYLNSAELGLLCTVPTESVPDFELRLEKKFPLVSSRLADDKIMLGNVIDGNNVLSNMPFGLSEKDLNKHTFVCGITGSGKTTTVKKILVEAGKPFLVIESAKKEYRNIAVDTEIYTLGNPEINAPKINPFYILPGVSPQVHIDYLKDLFNASFSFYGPMTYILEKCLHAVYKNKGWDLTLGYHPLLVNSKSPTDFFNIDYMKKQYSNIAHRFIFPTMQELKDEIARYIDEELKYDGEVAGNVKTAMKVRLENLCIGAKGYTFNTSECIDFEDLLEKNVVFELEGLADDSDKAFSVGLLVIFINEYRQVRKEILGNQNHGLQHLLIIEEAHRLLKNVDTERSSETSGNPKGKAVEHFTNMLAEMRSYGQGVIVAEQIPTKLAPDVIKNSSTKIVQRIVSVDDQRTIANTIGIEGKDAIQLGMLETGIAYCHKEGMVLPTPVKIADNYVDDENCEQSLDVFVSDERLYNNNDGRFEEIGLSIVRSFFGGNQTIRTNVVRFLNTMMVAEVDNGKEACKQIVSYITNEIRINDIRLTLVRDPFRIAARFAAENILSMMVRGVYCVSVLPENKFVELLEKSLYAPASDDIEKLKNHLRNMYSRDLDKYAETNVAALIKRSLTENTDIEGTVREYFYNIPESIVDKISEIMKGEGSA